ncbi:MAG: hypothetical protein WCQ60_02670, partial [bacterium]
GLGCVGKDTIILALPSILNANPEGEHTVDFLRGLLKPFTEKGITISILGRGLSTGSELEYSDADTIKNALKNRA